MPAAYEVTVIIFKYISLSLLKKEKKTTHRGKWKKRFLKLASCYCCSVAKLCPILWPHELQHARLPCPSLSPRVCLNSCPLNRWCHPAISFSVIPFSSCPESLPESGSFLMSQFFASGDQSIGASASASVLPKHILGWFPLGLTGWISLLSKGLSGVFSSARVLKHQFFSVWPLWSAFAKWHTDLPVPRWFWSRP